MAMKTDWQTQSHVRQGSPVANRPEPISSEREIRPLEDLTNYFREYSRQHPEMAALCCFSLGFVIGWKLKPW